MTLTTWTLLRRQQVGSIHECLTSCHLEMTEVEPVLDFASSGRSGRRNALPDILGSPAGVSPSDLPLKLAELSLTGKDNGNSELKDWMEEVTPCMLRSGSPWGRALRTGCKKVARTTAVEAPLDMSMSLCES
ncbi:cAMP-dependent protein kinase inhibitor beta-like [Scleropages formosus]|uniref:cAMP-dependent protein kinase inhibitor beta-like n=1 Tax=Scleropages formosus TaxID=113540 RepID=A0A0P7WA49_SCLFO|nr:cAMP-dependent protein kinase inhibitor beta-like [Scleropages formosus]